MCWRGCTSCPRVTAATGSEGGRSAGGGDQLRPGRRAAPAAGTAPCVTAGGGNACARPSQVSRRSGSGCRRPSSPRGRPAARHWSRRRRRGRRRGPHPQYAELEREATDRVFVLLVEFGDERHPDYRDVDTDPDWPGPARFDGPRHNAIPEPDRTVDNSTIWEPDFGREYFEELYFGTGEGVESLKTYYETQSSGRYSVEGTVTDWVRVPYNEARYGR